MEDVLPSLDEAQAVDRAKAAREDPFNYSKWDTIEDSSDDEHLVGPPQPIAKSEVPKGLQYTPPPTHEIALMAAAKLARNKTMEPYWSDVPVTQQAIEDFVLSGVSTVERALELLLGKARGIELSLPGPLTQTLLDLGARPDTQVMGRSWLHHAVDTQWPELDSVVMLCSARPTPSLRDDDGACALDRVLERFLSLNENIAYFADAHDGTQDFLDETERRAHFATVAFDALLNVGFDVDAPWQGHDSPRDTILAALREENKAPATTPMGPPTKESYEKSINDAAFAVMQSALVKLRATLTKDAP